MALPAAEKLTAGYRRGGEQVKRRISTEDELEPERWLREVAIVGGPDSGADRVGELSDEFGFGGFQLVTGFLGDLPLEHVSRTLTLFAAEVRPRFNRMTAAASGIAQPEGSDR